MKHFQTRDLEGDGSQLSLDEKRRLVAHLSKNCSVCWRALSEITSQDPRSLADPVQRALQRTRSAHRLELDSGHLRCLREARTQYMGFAELVLREAYSTFDVDGWKLAENLVEHFLGTEIGPEAHDLAAVGDLLLTRAYLRLSLFEDASDSSATPGLDQAEEHNQKGSRSRLLQAEVVFWRSLALCEQQEVTVVGLVEALDIIDSADPLLCFELAREIVARKVVSREPWPEVQRILALAFSQLSNLPQDDQLHGLYLKGSLASCIASRLNRVDFESFQDDFKVLGEQLHGALPEVQQLGDKDSEGWFCFWIASLLRDRESLTWWYRSLEKFAECGCESSFLRVINHATYLLDQPIVVERRALLRDAQRLAETSFDRETAAKVQHSLADLAVVHQKAICQTTSGGSFETLPNS